MDDFKKCKNEKKIENAIQNNQIIFIISFFLKNNLFIKVSLKNIRYKNDGFFQNVKKINIFEHFSKNCQFFTS